MTFGESNEATVTVAPASPGLVGVLHQAAAIATGHGHDMVGAEHLLAAMLPEQGEVIQGELR
ncbi:Clp protease N-terminal domain-containing protein [Nocardia panacis]|nr:Clp protease N-terminal domain-containing protein [Nocardia panacis]